jgi:hypothetical protein
MRPKQGEKNDRSDSQIRSGTDIDRRSH